MYDSDQTRDLSYDEVLDELLRLNGRDVSVCSGPLRACGRLALVEFPPPPSRSADLRVPFHLAVGSSAAFLLDRERVVAAWVDTWADDDGEIHVVSLRTRGGELLSLLELPALGE